MSTKLVEIIDLRNSWSELIELSSLLEYKINGHSKQSRESSMMYLSKEKPKLEVWLWVLHIIKNTG